VPLPPTTKKSREDSGDTSNELASFTNFGLADANKLINEKERYERALEKNRKLKLDSEKYKKMYREENENLDKMHRHNVELQGRLEGMEDLIAEIKRTSRTKHRVIKEQLRTDARIISFLEHSGIELDGNIIE